MAVVVVVACRCGDVGEAKEGTSSSIQTCKQTNKQTNIALSNSATPTSPPLSSMLSTTLRASLVKYISGTHAEWKTNPIRRVVRWRCDRVMNNVGADHKVASPRVALLSKSYSRRLASESSMELSSHLVVHSVTHKILSLILSMNTVI